MPFGNFQVKLSGDWKDFKGNDDKILKRAYLSGFPNAKYTLRGQKYEADFKNMNQKNLRTGKVRDVRSPRRLASAPPMYNAARPESEHLPRARIEIDRR